MHVDITTLDALKELFNIGVGRSAAILNHMLTSHVYLTVPIVHILHFDELKTEMHSTGLSNVSAVNLGFSGIFSGSALLMFPQEGAVDLVNAITGTDINELDIDEIRAGSLCEVGNVVLNAVMGTIANVLKVQFVYSVPYYLEDKIDNLLNMDLDDKDKRFLVVKTRFNIEALDIEGDIILFFKVGSIDNLLEAVSKYSM